MDFIDFRQYEGLLPQKSGELLAPKRFLNVSDSVLAFVALPPFFGGKKIPRNVSQLQKRPKRF